jgi:hypothetical protein
MKQCVVVMQESVVLSPNFEAKSSPHFCAVALKATVVFRIYCFVRHNKLFVNNPLDAKENNDQSLDFALNLSRFFGLP